MSAEIDIEKFTADLTARINRSISVRSMRRIGDRALRMIKDRIRKGKGVDSPGGREKRFKRLAPSTIKQRKRMRLSPFTSAGTSNATRSGRMIGGLRVTTRTGLMKIKPSGRSREGIPNQDVADYYSEARPFLNLSRGEVEDLAVYYEEQILDLRRL